MRIAASSALSQFSLKEKCPEASPDCRWGQNGLCHTTKQIQLHPCVVWNSLGYLKSIWNGSLSFLLFTHFCHICSHDKKFFEKWCGRCSLSEIWWLLNRNAVRNLQTGLHWRAASENCPSVMNSHPESSDCCELILSKWGCLEITHSPSARQSSPGAVIAAPITAWTGKVSSQWPWEPGQVTARALAWALLTHRSVLDPSTEPAWKITQAHREGDAFWDSHIHQPAHPGFLTFPLPPPCPFFVSDTIIKL